MSSDRPYIKVDITGNVDSKIAVVQNALDGHKAESVTDDGGVHGFEIEEGSWTPYFIVGETELTSSGNVGRYVKTNGKVHITGYVRKDSGLGVATGSIKIGGLPIVSRNVERLWQALSITQFSRIGLPTGYTQVSARLINNADTIHLMATKFTDDDTDSPAVSAEDNQSSNTKLIIISGTYLI